MRRAVVLLLCAVLAGCAAGQREGASAQPAAGAAGVNAAEANRAAIRALLTAYYADYSRRDWFKVVVHFWPGATVTTIAPGENGSAREVATVPVEEFIAEAESMATMPVLDEQLLRADIQIEGDLAQAWVTYQVRMGDESEVDTWAGLDAFTLMRLNGSWRITTLAFAPQ